MNANGKETVDVGTGSGTRSRGSDDDPSSLPDMDTLLEDREEVLSDGNVRGRSAAENSSLAATKGFRSSRANNMLLRLQEVESENVSEAESEIAGSQKRRKDAKQDRGQQLGALTPTPTPTPVADGEWGKKLSLTDNGSDGEITVNAFLAGQELELGSSRARRMAARLTDLDKEELVNHVKSEMDIRRGNSLARDKDMIKNLKFVPAGKWGRKLSVTMTKQEIQAKLAATSALGLESARAKEVADRLVQAESEINGADVVEPDPRARYVKPIPDGQWGRKLSTNKDQPKDAMGRSVVSTREFGSNQAKKKASRLLEADSEANGVEVEAVDPRADTVQPLADGEWGRKLSSVKQNESASLTQPRKFGSKRAQEMAARLLEVEKEIISEVDALMNDPRAENLPVIPDGEWGRRLSAAHTVPAGALPAEGRKFGSKQAKKMTERLVQSGKEGWGNRLSVERGASQDLDERGANMQNIGSQQAKRMTARLVLSGKEGWGKRLSVVNNAEDGPVPVSINSQNIESQQAKKMTTRLIQSGKEGWGKRLSVVHNAEDENPTTEDIQDHNLRRGAFGGRLSTVSAGAFGGQLSTVSSSNNLLGIGQDQLALLKEEEDAAIREELENNRDSDNVDITATTAPSNTRFAFRRSQLKALREEETAAIREEQESLADGASSEPDLSDVGKLLKENGLDQFLDILEDAGIMNIDEAKKLSFDDYKNMGIKKFKDKDRLRNLFVAAAKKPTKMLISYSIESSKQKGTRFSKLLNNVKLNYGKSSVDASSMTLSDALEAVENVDFVLVLMSDEYFSGPFVNLEARVATLILALRNKVPVFTTYAKNGSGFVANENKKLFSVMKGMIKELDQDIIESLAENGITNEDIFSAAERLSKTRAIPNDTLVIELDKEIKKLKYK